MRFRSFRNAETSEQYLVISRAESAGTTGELTNRKVPINTYKASEEDKSPRYAVPPQKGCSLQMIRHTVRETIKIL